jgi:N-formylmaleamate deformylase
MKTKITERDINVNNTHIHYTRTGTGDKPPLVLLHGFSDNGKCWLPVMQALAGDYDLILPDARGHGLSQRVQEGEAVDMAADAAGLIEALKLEQPVVGGHSMGAGVSADIGGRFAGLVRALILEDPGWRKPQPEPKPEQGKEPPSNPFLEWLLSMEKMTIEELMAKCHADSPAWAEAELQPWAESKKQLDFNILKTLRLPNLEWQQTVKGIVRPTLLITAEVEKGAIVSPQIAKKAAKLNNYIRVAHIPGAGHNIRRENTEQYLQAVRGFLSEIGY